MFENKENRTELSRIGEFGLISRLASVFPATRADTLTGIGDDAAVIDTGGQPVVISTDLLAEGVHFDLSYMPLKHLGYKAIVVNLSDIYAMNATPGQVLVSVALSNRFSLEAVEELFEGVRLACQKYQVDLAGGDTNASSSGLILSVTAIGKADRDALTYRHTAKEHDLICVSGDLGAAYLGLQLLNREKRVFAENPGVQPDLTGYDYLLERQLKPEARHDIVEDLRTAGVKPTSMMDISDGLASELFHICEKSGTGCRIYEEKIPIDVKSAELAEEFNMNPTVCALNGGEDYELLFTVNQNDFEKIRTIKDVHVIGHITNKDSGKALIGKGDTETPLKAQGWEAFKDRE